jgi:hypothetical protein
MPVTYQLIASNVLASAAASVTFSAIPATYTDLVVRTSIRTDRSTQPFDGINIALNNTSTNYSQTQLRGDGSAASSSRDTIYSTLRNVNGATSTSNTFASAELYIPNYAGSTNKPFSVTGAQENNQTAAYIEPFAFLWSNTAAISSIVFTPYVGPNFVAGSSFYLYGIKNS